MEARDLESGCAGRCAYFFDTSIIRVDPACSGGLRTLDQAMETRKPADLSVRHSGPESPRRLRSATAMGRRDYAILMMLAKLGLRAGEIATLTLDDIDWRSGEMLIRAKGRQRARMT
jgi:integrase